MNESFSVSDQEEKKGKIFSLIKDTPLIVVGILVITAYTCFSIVKKIKK